jgi:putative ABC transport system substrate-binding protein
MRRREFSALLGGAATASTVWSSPLSAQQKAMPVIGVINVGTPGTFAPSVAAFRQGLSETGYVEGQNLAIEYRWAEDRLDRLPALAADLVGRKVDVIVASTPLRHTRRKTQRRRSQSSSSPAETRSGMAWSPVSPGRAATSRVSASSLPS